MYIQLKLWIGSIILSSEFQMTIGPPIRKVDMDVINELVNPMFIPDKVTA